MLKQSPLFRGITAIGLVSSHPSACHALSKYTGTKPSSYRIQLSLTFVTQTFPLVEFSSLDLTFCQRNAKSILVGSPVAYVKDMELCGSLFEGGCTTGAVSCVFTNFYVDHNQPLEALAAYKAGF
jgi:hypothetical protein